MKCYGKSVDLLESVEVVGGGAGVEESSVKGDYFVWFGHLPHQTKMKAPISNPRQHLKLLIFYKFLPSSNHL